MTRKVKDRLYGLDDLVWRNLVWAARKPFAMGDMPKFLALRVDDFSGFGNESDRHRGWVLTANRYGLILWLGIFIDDLRKDEEATRRLAQLTQQRLATASVHARRWSEFFYLEMPLRKDETRRNIIAKSLPDETMAANFREAEQFFDKHRIVKSRLFLPHFYEYTPDNFPSLKEWGTGFARPSPNFSTSQLSPREG